MKSSKKFQKLIFFTIIASSIIWVFMRALIENFTDTGKIEIQTVRGSSPEIKNLMSDMNSIGNQLIEDAKYDKVDDKVLNAKIK